MNPAAEPVLFGQVKVLDKAGPYTLSTAIISLDEKLTFADAAGNYRLVLTPGKHQLMTGQIGIYQSRLTIAVALGDSVRIDFHLRPDQRPLN